MTFLKAAVALITGIKATKAPLAIKKRGRKNQMATKMLVAMPKELLETVDKVANKEQCSRSELVRVALRLYVGLRTY